MHIIDSEKFGKIKVLVEEGKKENRSKGNFYTSIRKFIKTYKTEDLYVVHTIPPVMRGKKTKLDRKFTSYSVPGDLIR